MLFFHKADGQIIGEVTLSTLTKHTHSADVREVLYLLIRDYQNNEKIEILLSKFRGCVLNLGMWCQKIGAKFLEAIQYCRFH